MGKKCFLPRCKSAYETCTEKVLLFVAPRETDRLMQIWRHAIPRKDLVLQSTDYVCEKHFEPGGSGKRRRADEVSRLPCSFDKDRKKKGACAPFAPSCHET
ncbi:hypothetical protein HPB49_001572 [Dermacentor silvarum]|uniref:Uncharacterized protein n=1 Tax=Dermacentor silvarum TaxID=543639 RepID=A0ACB8DA27_DERSI|nr:hypothetical protein HPB49_001572 [Dermacentor silvarum]